MTIYIFTVMESTPEKRAQILSAAERLYLRYGIRRTSVDDVAREAGIAKGTIYLYYDSKESLNAAVVGKICAEILDAGRQALAVPDTLVKRLVGFLDAWKGKPSRLIASSPHTAELIESTARVPAAITADFYAQMHAVLGSALRDAGIVHDDAATMLFAAAVGTLQTGDIGEAAYRSRLTLLVETLLRGLSARDCAPKDRGRQRMR